MLLIVKIANNEQIPEIKLFYIGFSDRCCKGLDAKSTDAYYFTYYGADFICTEVDG